MTVVAVRGIADRGLEVLWQSGSGAERWALADQRGRFV